MGQREDNNEEIDAIATIFYMINSLQELEPDDADLDDLGRFKYSSSYQFRFNNVNDNLVETIINDFCETHSIPGKKNRSVFFIKGQTRETAYLSVQTQRHKILRIK